MANANLTPSICPGKIVLGPRVTKPESKPCDYIPVRLVHPHYSGSWETATVAFDAENLPTAESVRLNIMRAVFCGGVEESVEPNDFGQMAPAVAAFWAMLDECEVVDENGATIPTEFGRFLDASRAFYAISPDDPEIGARHESMMEAAPVVDLGPGIDARLEYVVPSGVLSLAIGPDIVIPLATLESAVDALRRSGAFDGPQTVDALSASTSAK